MDYKKPKFKEKYENFIGGKFVPPVGNEYFENNSPIDNTLIAKYPRSQKEDIDNAVIAANKAKAPWSSWPSFWLFPGLPGTPLRDLLLRR